MKILNDCFPLLFIILFHRLFLFGRLPFMDFFIPKCLTPL